jgi:hypothetical protein
MVFSCLLDDLINRTAFVDVYQVKSVLQKGVNFIISTRQKHILACNRVRDQWFEAHVLQPVSLSEFLGMYIESEELNSSELSQHSLSGILLLFHGIHLLFVFIVFSLLCILLILKCVKDTDASLFLTEFIKVLKHLNFSQPEILAKSLDMLDVCIISCVFPIELQGSDLLFKSGGEDDLQLIVELLSLVFVNLFHTNFIVLSHGKKTQL